VLASECPSGMSKVTEPIKIAGATLSFERDRGGGCPTRPVYTAIFQKADPMPVRVCFDPGADMCEMFIKAEKVSIDLTEALELSGAKSASLME
jgi:hypothetical protein